MTTLAIMKTRIANELARDDLTSEIGYAISDAIKAYEDERWFFSESRDTTLTTVATQEFYDADDAAAFATLLKIDYVVVYIGDQPYTISPTRPVDIEHMVSNGTSTGVPSWYCYYNQQMRFYPVPDAAYTVRIAAAVKSAEPASDDEARNPWMTHAERLIRSRAKLELALHVLKDAEMAGTMSEAVTEAFEQLKERTGQITQLGDGRIRPMDF